MFQQALSFTFPFQDSFAISSVTYSYLLVFTCFTCASNLVTIYFSSCDFDPWFSLAQSYNECIFWKGAHSPLALSLLLGLFLRPGEFQVGRKTGRHTQELCSSSFAPCPEGLFTYKLVTYVMQDPKRINPKRRHFFCKHLENINTWITVPQSHSTIGSIISEKNKSVTWETSISFQCYLTD